MKSFKHFLKENFTYFDLLEEGIDFNSKTMKYVYYTLTTKHDSDKNIITDENGRKFEYYGSDKGGSTAIELYREHIPFKKIILYNNNKPVQEKYELTDKQSKFLNMPYTHHKINGGVNFEDLSDDEYSLISAWVGKLDRKGKKASFNFVGISSFLRYPSRDAKLLHKTDDLKKLTKWIKGVDKIFARDDAKLKEPIAVRRDVASEIFDSYHFKLGQIIKEQSYTATSTSNDAAGFFSGGNKYHFKILVPEGTPCIKINNNGESEILLPRKSIYEVVGIKGKGCGKDNEVVLKLVHNKDDLIYGGNTTDTPAKSNSKNNDIFLKIRKCVENNASEEEIEKLFSKIEPGTELPSMHSGSTFFTIVKTEDGIDVTSNKGFKKKMSNEVITRQKPLLKQIFCQ